ncbi:MAG: DedA family protein [Ignavibacteriales bacterium]|nr:DedA family protein [Ignavibacteriales bacterium]
MEEIIKNLSAISPLWIYIAVAGIAYIENIFPPFPSDVVVVFAGSLIGVGTIDFTAALMLSTVGSTLGFMTMYKIGHWFGDRILEAGKIKFIPRESVLKVEGWFQKYGYWIIIVNRFLSGTRAVVSFFAGMSELSLAKTTILSFLSAMVWNFILLLAGQKLGQNWREIGFYLETYSKTVTAILIVGALLATARYIYKRTNNSAQQPNDK